MANTTANVRATLAKTAHTHSRPRQHTALDITSHQVCARAGLARSISRADRHSGRQSQRSSTSTSSQTVVADLAEENLHNTHAHIMMPAAFWLILTGKRCFLSCAVRKYCRILPSPKDFRAGCEFEITFGHNILCNLNDFETTFHSTHIHEPNAQSVSNRNSILDITEI